MVNPRSRSPVSPGLLKLIRLILVGLFVVGIGGGALAWLFPVEIVQAWVLEQTTGDDYRKFEAIGRAEAACWLVRFFAPVIGLVAGLLLRNTSGVSRFLAESFRGGMNATDLEVDRGASRGWRTVALRGFFVGWALLALGHYGHAMMERLTQWPYYRFKSGVEVLPNISDSNRMVTRYLIEATKPGDRIFVASDQKLYFLSYYLLPGRLYYQAHPDSEFLIAQPHLQRHMTSYRLSEIDPQVIERIAPDYILEYFEEPDYVDPARMHDDQAWTSFYRTHNADPLAEPPYLVCLRRFEKGGRR